MAFITNYDVEMIKPSCLKYRIIVAGRFIIFEN